MMANLDGMWFYQSFCPKGGSAETPPQIAAPWAPPGQLHATTDAATGKVTGTLEFAPGVELAVSGAITPAADKLPEGIELIGENPVAAYNIRGYFVPLSTGPGCGPVIVGTVVAVRNDLAKQPVGTSGPFVLFPAAGY
jgi:hypothetical protein